MPDTKRSGTFFVSGEKIVLKRDATWVADGIEITHEQTRELFYRAISWDAAQKKYCLKVGYETIFIEVEDTPYFVTSIDETSAKTTARLTNDAHVELKADNLKYERGNLYLLLPDGQRAKFLSSPYYALLRHLEEDGDSYTITIAGQTASLAPKSRDN